MGSPCKDYGFAFFFFLGLITYELNQRQQQEIRMFKKQNSGIQLHTLCMPFTLQHISLPLPSRYTTSGINSNLKGLSTPVKEKLKPDEVVFGIKLVHFFSKKSICISKKKGVF